MFELKIDSNKKDALFPKRWRGSSIQTKQSLLLKPERFIVKKLFQTFKKVTQLIKFSLTALNLKQKITTKVPVIMYWEKPHGFTLLDTGERSIFEFA